jgi:hypothetical protein
MFSASFIISAILAGLLSWSFGKTSNGMTSPRQAFNFMIPVFSAAIGLAVGVFAALLGSTLGLPVVVLGNCVVGLVCGIVVLHGVRMARGGW